MTRLVYRSGTSLPARYETMLRCGRSHLRSSAKSARNGRVMSYPGSNNGVRSMRAIISLLYRQYCWARLVEMRKYHHATMGLIKT
jgi:hypothetical protein